MTQNKNIISFSGSHGCGKSTIAYIMASYLKRNSVNVAVVDELARECPLPINKTATINTQYWIITAQIQRELNIKDRYDYIISDRSPIDTVCYGLILDKFDKDSIKFISEYIKSNYKLIFVLNPNTFNYQIDDGVRDMDKEFRLLVHKKIIDIYTELGIYFISIDSEDEIYDMINYHKIVN